MKGIKCLLRLFVCFMLVMVMQKGYFLYTTWQEGGTVMDVTEVIYHGLKLDAAVACYLLVLPWLVLCLHAFASRYLTTRLTRRMLWAYYTIAAVVVAVIVVADASLYTFWHFKLDASALLYTDKPKDAMASVSLKYILQRVALIAVWTWLMIGLCKALKTFRDIDFTARKPLTASVFLIIGALLFVTIRGGIGKGTNNVSAAYYSDSQYLNHCAVNPVFNLIYSLGKQEDFGREHQYFSDGELRETLKDIYGSNGTEDGAAQDTLLNTTRPDIVLLIWEGASQYMCDTLGITPNLRRLAAEGISFTNCYANSFRTDRGQLSLLAGWPAIPNTSIMKLPEKCDHLPSIARELLHEGYTTTFWYGGDIAFANTGGYMHQSGFQRTVSEDDFSKKDIATDWGVYDGTLLQKAAQEIVSEKEGGRHFHTIMTLSSHEPWTVPVKKYQDERQNAFYYTDKCIGEFVETLRKSPRWSNTLLIITSDHGVIMKEGTGLADASVTRIPMVFTGGAVKKVVTIDKIINQTDLAATLLAQMNVSHEKFIFSRNVVSKAYTYPTAFHCYNGGISFADSTGYSTYDIEGERPVWGDDPERIKKAKATLQLIYKRLAEL